MHRALPRRLSALLLLCSGLPNCSPAQGDAITSTDAAEVLALAARAAAQSGKFSTGYCVQTRLDPGQTVIVPTSGDGWSSPSSGLSYRLVKGPKARQIPHRVMTAFPTSARRAGCRHSVTFHEPQFMEVRRKAETAMWAIVAVDDRCPTCGAGYSIGLKRSGTIWQVESGGMQMTWIS